jgi:2-hydroxycyclohexanecarboxyl-CoA dehydrogenase
MGTARWRRRTWGAKLPGLIEGKTAIVTGAANGIGRAIGLTFASEGAHVALVDIDGPGVAQVGREIEANGGRALALETDIGIRSAVDDAVRRAMGAFGPGIDVLVNTAISGAPRIPILETSEELCEAMFRTGPLATLFFIQACVPHMEGRGGSIINFGSGADIAGTTGYAAYAPAKAGVRALTKVAARELGPQGIRVNCIAPLAKTRLLTAMEEEDPERARLLLDALPLRRFAEPAEIAKSAVYLASDLSSYVTGDTLFVDGGSCIV